VNKVIADRVLSAGQTLQIVQGDITVETTDAIVNAANEHLRHGAGVAGAIVRRGGEAIQRESDQWVREHGPVSHAHPAWTPGGQLAAKYVIHAVGPVWGSGEEDAKLASAIRGSLEVADELHLASIALPALSTGIFGFPVERAARIIFAAIEKYFSKASSSSVKQVRIVLFDQVTVDAFLKSWPK